MNVEVKESLEVSLSFIEMNINLLRTALSKASIQDDSVLNNERAILIISKVLELFESITLSLEDINQPIEDEIKEAAKELLVNLRRSLDSSVSAPLLDESVKEEFREVRGTLERFEREHQERRHSIRLPASLCPTLLCD